MNKASISDIILYSIQYFGIIILLLCSVIFLNVSGEISAILTGCGYIVYSVSQAIRVRGKSSLSIAVFGLVILALGVVTYLFVIGTPTIDTIIGFVMKCLSGISILIITAVQPLIDYSKRFDIKISLRKLVNWAYLLMPLLIIAGAALTIFVQFLSDFKFYVITIIGCGIWLALTVYTVYLMITHEYDDSLLETERAIFRYISRNK